MGYSFVEVSVSVAEERILKKTSMPKNQCFAATPASTVHHYTRSDAGAHLGDWNVCVC